MKSYFLSPVASRKLASETLNSVLPGQGETWLLKDKAGDVIAYFNLVEADGIAGAYEIQADISGRHYNRDEEVVSILKTLKQSVGGKITNDA